MATWHLSAGLGVAIGLLVAMLWMRYCERELLRSPMVEPARNPCGFEWLRRSRACASFGRCCVAEPTVTVRSRWSRGIALPLLLSVPFIVTLATTLAALGQGEHKPPNMFVFTTIVMFFLCLPMWACASPIYWNREAYMLLVAHPDVLRKHKLRHKWFLRAYRWHVVAAMVLPMLVQMPYMANELYLFVDTANRKPMTPSTSSTSQSCQLISADALRSLAPVAVVLNFCSCVMLWAIVYWMIAETTMWTLVNLLASLIGGVLIGVSIAVIVAGSALMHGLSEPQIARDWADAKSKPRDPHSEARRSTLVVPVSASGQTPWKLALARAMTWAGSWEVQTTAALANHLVTIATMLWGILLYGSEGGFVWYALWVGMMVAIIGTFVSASSIIGRKYPHRKLLPSDDSFRVTCMAKAALVVLKAFIVSSTRGNTCSAWRISIMVTFYTSFFIVALLTLATAVPKLWRHPHLLQAVGIDSSRIFLVQYMLGYVATKLGVLLLTFSHILPDAAKAALNLHRSDTTDLLEALFWLPFAIYSNNEMAQLLDGLWWQHTQGQAGALNDRRRVGLTTTQHGVKAVSPLVEVIVLGSLGWQFLLIARCLLNCAIAEGTDSTDSSGSGQLVLGSCDSCWRFHLGPSWFINIIMLVRTFLHCHQWCAGGEAHQTSTTSGGSPAAPLLLGSE